MNSLFPEGSIVLNQDVLLQLISNCTDPTRLITLAKLFDRYFSDKETAYRLLERALAAQTLALGDFHFDVSITMQIMGQIHWNEGNQQAALDKFDRVYEIQKHKLGYNDIRVALALDDKASIHFSKGRLEEARKLYQRSFVIKRKLFGENHPETAEVCLNLARIFQAQGKFQDASRKSISALNIFQNYLDEDNCLIVDALICLAEVKHSEDYHDMSIETYERALALTKKAHGENNVRVADISYKIALVEKDRGRKSKRTIDLLKNAYHIYFKEYGPRHEKTMVCKRQLQRLYYATASMQGLHTSVPDSLRLSDGERSISSSFSLSSVFSKTSSWFQNKLEY
jgi:tetratricopeptide (TPR) repeat protein